MGIRGLEDEVRTPIWFDQATARSAHRLPGQLSERLTQATTPTYQLAVTYGWSPFDPLRRPKQIELRAAAQSEALDFALGLLDEAAARSVVVTEEGFDEPIVTLYRGRCGHTVHQDPYVHGCSGCRAVTDQMRAAGSIVNGTKGPSSAEFYPVGRRMI